MKEIIIDLIMFIRFICVIDDRLEGLLKRHFTFAFAGRSITNCMWPQRLLPEMKALHTSPGVTALLSTHGTVKDTLYPLTSSYCVWLWRWRRRRMGACACPYVTQREHSKLYNWVISLVAKCDDQWWFSLDIGAIYWKLLFSSHDQLYGLSVGILGVKCCRLVIVAMCGFRGEVISKAGPEEAVIYADIGEWEERVDQTVPIPDRGVRAGVVIVSCVH